MLITLILVFIHQPIMNILVANRGYWWYMLVKGCFSRVANGGQLAASMANDAPNKQNPRSGRTPHSNLIVYDPSPSKKPQRARCSCQLLPSLCPHGHYSPCLEDGLIVIYDGNGSPCPCQGTFSFWPHERSGSSQEHCMALPWVDLRHCLCLSSFPKSLLCPGTIFLMSFASWGILLVCTT